MGNSYSDITVDQFLIMSGKDQLKVIQKVGFGIKLAGSDQQLIRYLLESSHFDTCMYLLKKSGKLGDNYIRKSLCGIDTTEDSTIFEYAIFSHCYPLIDYLLDNYREIIENSVQQINGIISDFKPEHVVDYCGNVATSDYVIGKLIANPVTKSLLMQNTSVTYINLVLTTDMKYFELILDVLKKYGLHTCLIENNRFVNHLKHYRFIDKITMFKNKFDPAPNYASDSNGFPIPSTPPPTYESYC